MGYSISYIAVKSHQLDSVLETLALFKTTKKPDGDLIVDHNEMIAGELNSGWSLILDATWSLISKLNLLSELSKETIVVVGGLVESTNFSSVSYWQDGAEKWSVVHSGTGVDIKIEGKFPKDYATIVENAIELKKETPPSETWDVLFGVPIQIYEDLVGYHYIDFVETVSANELASFRFLKTK